MLCARLLHAWPLLVQLLLSLLLGSLHLIEHACLEHRLCPTCMCAAHTGPKPASALGAAPGALPAAEARAVQHLRSLTPGPTRAPAPSPSSPPSPTLLSAHERRRRLQDQQNAAAMVAAGEQVASPQKRRRSAGSRLVASPAASNGASGGAASSTTSTPALNPRVALWVPPASPYSLLEECLYADPWRLLVACMLLNKTSGTQVQRGCSVHCNCAMPCLCTHVMLPRMGTLCVLATQVRLVLGRLFSWYPTPEALAALVPELSPGAASSPQLHEADSQAGAPAPARTASNSPAGAPPSPSSPAALPHPGGRSLADLQQLLRPLGLHRKRALALARFSHEYLARPWWALFTWWRCAGGAAARCPACKVQPVIAHATHSPPRAAPRRTDPRDLHGIGQYAADAYSIFCRGRWRDVQPEDKDLRRYRDWLESTGEPSIPMRTRRL